MKTFRMIGMALVAMMLSFAMSSCDNDDDVDVDPYKDYPQLIVGQWFNFTPEASMFLEYNADNTCKGVGWDKAYGHLSQFQELIVWKAINSLIHILRLMAHMRW